MTQDTQTPQQPRWEVDMSEFGGTRLALKPEQFGQEVLFEHASFDEIRAVQALLTTQQQRIEALEAALREAMVFIGNSPEPEQWRKESKWIDEVTALLSPSEAI